MLCFLGVSGVTGNFLIYCLEFIYLSRWEAVTNDYIGNTNNASSLTQIHSRRLSGAGEAVSGPGQRF